VRQEFYGFLLTHFAIRGPMQEAALSADEDPDRLSFLHAVRVTRRKLSAFVISPCSQEENEGPSKSISPNSSKFLTERYWRLRHEVRETASRLTEAQTEFPFHGNKTNHPELSSLSRG
jgi:hypothetical protein